MAQRIWIGGSAAGSQQSKATPGGTIGTETFTLTMNSITIASYTATSGDGAEEVASGLVASWNASAHPYASGITAAQTTGDDYLTLVADVPGTPFPYAPAGSATGSATLTVTSVSANYSPNDWNNVTNWQGNTQPSAGDDVVIQGSTSILYGLDQSSVALASVRVRDYSGDLGAAGEPLKLELQSSGGIFEYDSTGMGYIRLTHASSGSSSPLITGTSGSSTYGLFLTGDKFITLTLLSGSVALAIDPGETLEVTTIIQSYISNALSDSTLTIGSGVTGPSSANIILKKSGGSCTLYCPADTIENANGDLRSQGTGAIGTLTILGGTFIANSSGTITTLTASGGTTDFTQTQVARTVTSTTLSAGAILMADADVMTFTNKIAIAGKATMTVS